MLTLPPEDDGDDPLLTRQEFACVLVVIGFVVALVWSCC